MSLRRLRSDNFTPLSRTPWGGSKILRRFKPELTTSTPFKVVGESWEVSVEPSYPSYTHDTDEQLGALIAEEPEYWLGAAAAVRYGNQTPLLIKLLDTSDNLSVQVHPADDDPHLGPDESGKPEAWIILDADPGAGIYLGFKPSVGREEVVRCLNTQDDLSRLMNFVEVNPGDCFVIDAGTPHCIGDGVTLVEPQFVTPGKRGITYRFWDWNRTYDPAGKPDPKGAPRPLHVERSLAVTRWEDVTREAFVTSCRRESTVLLQAAEGLELKRWIQNSHFIVHSIEGTGTLELPPTDAMLTFTCVAGTLIVAADEKEVRLATGQSGVLPAAASRVRVTGSQTHVITCQSPC